jgi:hypothetical protein
LNSQKKKPATMTRPRIMGSSVRHESHSYMTPPVDTPNKKLVDPTVNSTEPTQSIRPSFERTLPGMLAWFK